MAEPTKAQLQEKLAEVSAELADRRPGVYVAIHGILHDIPEIKRRRVQTFQAFNVDDVYATLRPLMIRHGLILLPRAVAAVYDHGTFAKGTEFIDSRIHMEYDLVAISDGSKHTISFMAEGRDTQDKATNKAAQQALKYALIQMFLINSGEDAEEDPGEGDKPVARRQQRPAPQAAAEPTAKEIAVRLTNAARTRVFELVGKDKEEAGIAWKIILESLRMEEVITEADRDLVIEKAEELYAPTKEEAAPITDGSDAPFDTTAEGDDGSGYS